MNCVCDATRGTQKRFQATTKLIQKIYFCSWFCQLLVTRRLRRTPRSLFWVRKYDDDLVNVRLQRSTFMQIVIFWLTAEQKGTGAYVVGLLFRWYLTLGSLLKWSGGIKQNVQHAILPDFRYRFVLPWI